MKLKYEIFAKPEFATALNELLKDPFNHKEKIKIAKMAICIEEEGKVFHNLRKSLMETLTEIKNKYNKSGDMDTSEIQAIPEIQKKLFSVNEELERFMQTEFNIDYEKIPLSENTLLTAFDIVTLKDILILPK